MSGRWLATLIAIPMAYAAVTLAMAAGNRGTAREPIVLTHREVEAPVRNDENSATRLRLSWQPPLSGPMSWFDRDALRDLGFDVSVDPAAPDAERHYRRMLPREAFVAFEYDGPAWQAVVAAREAAEPAGVPRPAGDLRDWGSRLVPIEAAADPAALAQRYPDGRTHLISAAVVRLELVSATGGRPYLSGLILNSDPTQIYVPRDLARRLPLREPGDGTQAPYEVTLGYGERWEPFVLAISRGAALRSSAAGGWTHPRRSARFWRRGRAFRPDSP